MIKSCSILSASEFKSSRSLLPSLDPYRDYYEPIEFFLSRRFLY